MASNTFDLNLLVKKLFRQMAESECFHAVFPSTSLQSNLIYLNLDTVSSSSSRRHTALQRLITLFLRRGLADRNPQQVTADQLYTAYVFRRQREASNIDRSE